MSRLLFNHSGIAADAFGHLLGLSRLLTGDVIEGFQVQAKATPNMSVTVGQGSAGISSGTYPDNFRYWIANDTTSGSPAGESVTITTASSSNPRIDTIVAYVNEGGTFSTSPVNQPGGWTAAAVAGTPASSPSAPSGATIQSAIGAGNPYIVLANVLVGTSVTQINSGNITDLRSFAGVGAQNVSSSAITLGYAQVVAAQSFTNTLVAATGLTTTVIVPVGGRRIKITVYISGYLSSVNLDIAEFSIYEGATKLSSGVYTMSGNANSTMLSPVIMYSTIPSAGSHTYFVQLQRLVGSGTNALGAGTTQPSFILVEAI